MSDNHSPTAHFRRRRQLLLGTGAAFISAGSDSFAQSAAKPLLVGGLPVTCNLTLPVACSAMATNAGGATAPLFEFSKYAAGPSSRNR
jgi:NitT/TauT family transport system substrate-binding protein